MTTASHGMHLPYWRLFPQALRSFWGLMLMFDKFPLVRCQGILILRNSCKDGDRGSQSYTIIIHQVLFVAQSACNSFEKTSSFRCHCFRHWVEGRKQGRIFNLNCGESSGFQIFESFVIPVVVELTTENNWCWLLYYIRHSWFWRPTLSKRGSYLGYSTCLILFNHDLHLRNPRPYQ